MFKHILVPIDGTTLSLKAARAAMALARKHAAKVTALHVIPRWTPPMGSDGVVYYPDSFSPQEYKKLTEAEAKRALAKVEALARRARVRCDTLFVTQDAPWEAIVTVARRRKCDLVAMASHGRRGIAGLLLGSETMKVLTHSRVPVLVLR
jgi:nucleotide-binding universal stress UspA family protein